MSQASEQRWIFGCGYLGARVARRWHEQGHRVHVVTRSADKAKRLAAHGWIPVVADVKQAKSLPETIVAERVLYSVGFDRQGPETIDVVYRQGLENVLARLAPELRTLVYISSTGVFGPGNGEWVDESSPCQPQRDGGRACLACEQLLAQHPLGDRSMILRLAGIYGPGRIPNIQNLKQGAPVRGYSTGYLNLIHVDDAASIVDQVLTVSGPELFVVSDGTPVLRRDYYDYLARQCGAPEPTFIEPESGSAKSQRGAGSKRVSNQKLVERLGFQPRFPSFKTGLDAILADSDNETLA